MTLPEALLYGFIALAVALVVVVVIKRINP